MQILIQIQIPGQVKSSWWRTCPCPAPGQLVSRSQGGRMACVLAKNSFYLSLGQRIKIQILDLWLNIRGKAILHLYHVHIPEQIVATVNIFHVIGAHYANCIGIRTYNSSNLGDLNLVVRIYVLGSWNTPFKLTSIT